LLLSFSLQNSRRGDAVDFADQDAGFLFATELSELRLGADIAGQDLSRAERRSSMFVMHLSDAGTKVLRLVFATDQSAASDGPFAASPGVGTVESELSGRSSAGKR
jgi:hypothetical protein